MATALTLFVGLVVCRSAGAHHAVLRFNLEEMVVIADRVFIGRCIGIEPGVQEIAQGRLKVTRYTFRVERALKGELPPRFTFTQLGHPPRPARRGEPSSEGRLLQTGIMLRDAPDYVVGDRLLMLLSPSHMNGRLTYPVGLDQGAFVLDDPGAAGEVSARNNLDNLGLFSTPYTRMRLTSAQAAVIRPEAARPLAAAPELSDAARALADRRGALPLGPLVELIERIHAAHGGATGRVVRDRIGGRP
jgi:hypothetical protein